MRSNNNLPTPKKSRKAYRVFEVKLSSFSSTLSILATLFISSFSPLIRPHIFFRNQKYLGFLIRINSYIFELRLEYQSFKWWYSLLHWLWQVLLNFSTSKCTKIVPVFVEGSYWPDCISPPSFVCLLAITKTVSSFSVELTFFGHLILFSMLGLV